MMKSRCEIKNRMRTSLRIITLCVITGLILSWLYVGSVFAQSETSKDPVYLLDIKGVINPFTAKYAMRGIYEAETNNAQLVVIRMDTPGGLDTSMRDIDSAILNANIPVAVFVSPKGARAASAGVFITYASDIAAMSPGTNIGAAHHVNIGGGGQQKDDSWVESIMELYKKYKEEKAGQQPGQNQPETSSSDQKLNQPASEPQTSSTPKTEEEVMSEKITNDAVAYITAIAELKGRNVEWAVKAVTESVSIPASEAFSIGVIEYMADSMDDLLNQLNGKTIQKADREYVLNTADAPVRNIPMSAIEILMFLITNPQVAYILFIIGIYGLIHEVTHPGAIFPGVVGAICLVLAMMAFSYLPITTIGVVLIVLGIAFLIAELKVPGVGILAAGGVISLLLGSFLLVDRNYGEMVIKPGTYIPLVALISVMMIIVLPLVYKATKGKVVTGLPGIMGMVGTVSTEINPVGKVYLHGEYWSARSNDGSKIEKNEKIEVVSKTDYEMELVVKRRSN
jgi:membrane-bound serine protease (ClpP class)